MSERQREQVVCDCEYSFEFDLTPFNNYINKDIVVVKGCGEEFKLFTATMRVCVKGGKDCPAQTSGRGEDIIEEHVVVSGQLAGCNDAYPDWKTFVIFPKEGVSAEQLQYSIIYQIQNID